LQKTKGKHKTDVQSETKAKNVFKIAFGSKLPSNATSNTAASAKKKNQKVSYFYSDNVLCKPKIFFNQASRCLNWFTWQGIP